MALAAIYLPVAMQISYLSMLRPSSDAFHAHLYARWWNGMGWLGPAAISLRFGAHPGEMSFIDIDPSTLECRAEQGTSTGASLGELSAEVLCSELARRGRSCDALVVRELDELVNQIMLVAKGGPDQMPEMTDEANERFNFEEPMPDGMFLETYSGPGEAIFVNTVGYVAWWMGGTAALSSVCGWFAYRRSGSRRTREEGPA